MNTSSANINSVLKKYRTSFDGEVGYVAGLQNYKRNFTRDALISAILTMNEEVLLSQLDLCVRHQGRRYDSRTGEEPGKIHHEYPGITMPGRGDYLTTYNACDTTGLFLIGIEALGRISQPQLRKFLSSHESTVAQAITYLKRHLMSDIFYEFPPPGADRFCLYSTYWKDSVIATHSKRLQTNIDYPIAYGLVQFITARGLLSASRVLNDDDLAALSHRMFVHGIKRFITKDHFLIASSPKIDIEHDSSDELQILAYLPAAYRRYLPLNAMKRRAEGLETPIGYACSTQQMAAVLSDKYHGYVVWPFEQALINYGATKFSLLHQAVAAAKTAPFIKDGYELLNPHSAVSADGNINQLWSSAAALYFTNPARSRERMAWL
jgi:hypothetical protein